MRIIYFLMALGIALVFYLSWIPSPSMERVWFIPDWLARWSDRQTNGDLRTAIPFLFLGTMIGVRFSQNTTPAVTRWILAFLGLTFIAVIAELGQLLLPHRYFKIMDIVWGSVGAFVGLSMGYLTGRLMRG
ncbi:hypothetical protein [Larkinella sp. VNQ87]|uniref:hypothetical protein n=1 Tax=Larkinella sp. VNQ87 TaxID=3400921 RepID=UPI003C2F78EF